MNIPEVNKDMMQDFRKEGTAPVASTARSAPASSSEARPDAVQKQDKSGSEPQQKAYTKEEMANMVREVEEKLKSEDVQLKFNIVEDSGTIQVEVLNGDGKVIRKIPEDAVLKISQSIKDLARGFLDTRS